MKVDSKIILRENISISEVYSVIKESEYWINEKKLRGHVQKLGVNTDYVKNMTHILYKLSE